MKLYKILIAAFAGSLLLQSCVKNVLDKENLQNLSAEQIFNDSALVKLNIDNLYEQNLPTWFGNTGGAIGGGNTLTEEQYGDNVYVRGTVTSETVGDFGVANSKGNNYGKIRSLNMFIRDVNAGTLADPVKKRFTSQALFFRAFRYFDLVRLYGGVPLVLTPLEAVGDEAKAAALLPRNTTTECFKQIVSDLDTAIKYLPRKWSNLDYGRITAGAAAAFKGRVLLTYASPQFNRANLQDRWTAAYNANTQAVTILKASGFGLHPSYDGLWFVEGAGSANPEAIMVNEYNTSNSENAKKNNTYDNSTRPSYLGTGGGSNQPTWDMVSLYPMKDGQLPTVSTKYPYSFQTFYKDRDPRFNKTIAFNGCNWPILGNANYRLWTYSYYSNTAGTATRSTEVPSATNTGFYLRKAIDPNISISNLAFSGTDWIEIRYAEVLLNLAECAAEIGNLGVGQEAYRGLIDIRARAGIEPGADNMYGLTPGLGRADLVKAIMFERQIELAYEGKRYWDLRRRMLLESTLNGKRRQRINITLKNTGTATDYIALTRDASAVSNLDALYTTSFNLTLTNLDTYNLAVQSATYFFGIPTSAITNNTKLQQNNTWGGPFDPLL